MKIWWNNTVDSERKLTEVAGNRIRIGRDGANDLVLNSPFVANEAAVLYRRGDAWEFAALGLNQISVGSQTLYGGERATIDSDVVITIFPFTLSLDLPKKVEATKEASRRQQDEKLSETVAEIHLQLLRRLGQDSDQLTQQDITDDRLLEFETTIDKLTEDQGFLESDEELLTARAAGQSIRSRLLASVSETESAAQLSNQATWSRMLSTVPDRERELAKTAQYLSKLFKLNETISGVERIKIVETQFWDTWDDIHDDFSEEFLTYLARHYIKKEIKDIAFGYGPLEDLINLPTISEIMVVDKDHIYVENAGVVQDSGRRFISTEVTLAIIERIVSLVGRRIDKSQPLVDARLMDGSRVNAVIPPIAVSGPCITIRKFPMRKLLIDDLVGFGSLTRTAAEFLRSAVLAKKNLLISGGTGTGKTTLLNCLSDFIPDDERIVTIEDTAELQLKKQHVVSLEAKPANVEGTGAFHIRDLVKNSLRMRPDRIVVGECRGPEALDMLQAMNTGHDGSLTTIHANDAADVVLRLEVLVQMAADLPIVSIHRQVASAIDLIVQLHRMRNGRRAVTQISEVVGIDIDTQRVKTRDLYVLADHEDPKSELTATGHLPTFVEELIEQDLLDLESFYEAV